MKVKSLWIFLLSACTLASCDDNTGSLGWEMMPDSDVLTSHTTTFDVMTQSVAVDSVYARSTVGYVGRFTDPEFGFYEASFLTELNCTDNFRFPSLYQYNAATNTGTGTMAGDTIDDIRLVVYYSKWFGDSLNAARMSVFQLNNQWLQDRNSTNRNYRYTNINTDKYYDKSSLMGQKVFSAYDTSVSDSIRYGKDSNGNALYYPNVTFTLPKAYGQRILDLNRTHPEYFKNAETFVQNVLPGVYIKTDYGDGTILYIDRVDINMRLRFYAVDSTGVAMKKKVDDEYGKAGDDSLYYSREVVFSSTKEVIQANKFANSDKIKTKIAETEHTYIKTPAGIFTAATIPYDQIYEQLKNDTINAAKLTFTNYQQQSTYDFSMDAPTYVLLIRQKDVKKFFEDNQLNDNKTSFIATHNSVTTNQYVFGNIARLIVTTIQEKKAEKAKVTNWTSDMESKWQEENKLLLIPVSLKTISTSSGTSTSSTTIRIENDLAPSYAKLKGGTATEGNSLKNPLTLEVTYTTFGR